MIVKNIESLEEFLDSGIFFISDDTRNHIHDNLKRIFHLPDKLFPFEDKDIKNIDSINKWMLAQHLDINIDTYYKGKVEEGLYLVETENSVAVVDEKVNNSTAIKSIVLFGFLLEDKRYIPTEYSPSEVQNISSSAELKKFSDEVGKDTLIELSTL